MNVRSMLGALAVFAMQTALALPLGGGGDGPINPGDDPPVDPLCARQSKGNVTATPASINLGQSVTLSWSVPFLPGARTPARSR